MASAGQRGLLRLAVGTPLIGDALAVDVPDDYPEFPKHARDRTDDDARQNWVTGEASAASVARDRDGKDDHQEQCADHDLGRCGHKRRRVIHEFDLKGFRQTQAAERGYGMTLLVRSIGLGG